MRYRLPHANCKDLFCLDGVPVLIEPGGKKKMDLCPTLAGLWAAPGLLPVVKGNAHPRTTTQAPARTTPARTPEIRAEVGETIARTWPCTRLGKQAWVPRACSSRPDIQARIDVHTRCTRGDAHVTDRENVAVNVAL